MEDSDRPVLAGVAASPRAAGPAAHHAAALIALALVALVLRLVYLSQFAALPFFDDPVGESAVHLKLAREIASGALLPSRPFFYASVLYPYFLAGVLALGGNLIVVCLLQALGGASLVLLLGALATRLYGRGAGLVTAALTALYGPFAFLEVDVLGIVWALAGVSAAVLLAVRWEDAEDRAARVHLPLVLAGLALGVAAAERPNLVLLVPALAAWCAWCARRHRMLPAVAVAAGAALPLALVVLLNFSASGQWIPLATSRGLNLYIGFHPGAAGTYDEPWANRAAQFNARYTELEDASIRMASSASRRALTPEQASDFWTTQALDYIRSHPVESIGLIARKAALMLNAVEVPNHLNFEFIRARAPALWAMPVGFGWVAPLAAAGIGFVLIERRRRAATLLLLLVSATTAASVLPFFVAERYRAPIVPSLLVLAGAGVMGLGALLTRSARLRERRVAWTVASAVIVALVAHVPMVQPLLSRDHWIFAQAYAKRGELAAAAASYEAAVRAKGDDGELLNNLALMYRDMGQRGRAEVTLRRAIAANPALAYPRKNLGMLLIGRKDYEGAMKELMAALRIEPDDAEALGAVGALHAERGAWSDAAAAFARARALAPNDARLERLIASYPDLLERAASQRR